ncbi:hypothetical protein D3C74_422540 [compost metagenome]
MRYQLDVAQLFSCYTHYQIVEGLQLVFGTEVKRLIEIIVKCGHLAEFSSKQFLYGGCGIRVRLLDIGNLDHDLIHAFEH